MKIISISNEISKLFPEIASDLANFINSKFLNYNFLVHEKEYEIKDKLGSGGFG